MSRPSRRQRQYPEGAVGEVKPFDAEAAVERFHLIHDPLRVPEAHPSPAEAGIDAVGAREVAPPLAFDAHDRHIAVALQVVGR